MLKEETMQDILNASLLIKDYKKLYHIMIIFIQGQMRI